MAGPGAGTKTKTGQPDSTSAGTKPDAGKGAKSDAKPGEGRCGRENEKGARIRFQRSLFRVIPARFERATRSLEGCCSVQLNYWRIA